MTENVETPLQKSLLYFFQDIKLAHSVFALPFVFASLVFIKFQWSIFPFIYIVLCMISARSFAMGMNRYLDRHWDALNPRTKQRMIPKGVLKSYQGLFWSLLSSLLFVFFSFQLNLLAGYCSPFVLIILGFYPLMKSMSWLTHWYLGFCLALSPIAASVALKSSVEGDVLLLSFAIMMWTAGFDILYALQDYHFDQRLQLKSVPTRFGVRKSLWISRFCFFCMLTALFTIGMLRQAGWIYFVGIFIISGILIWEQWLVRHSNEDAVSSNINIAFFNANACVGIAFYIFTQLDAMIQL